MERGGAYYSESAAALMADVWSDAGSVQVVNVRNDGALPGLPDDVVIEAPARIGRDGAVAAADGAPARRRRRARARRQGLRAADDRGGAQRRSAARAARADHEPARACAERRAARLGAPAPRQPGHARSARWLSRGSPCGVDGGGTKTDAVVCDTTGRGARASARRAGGNWEYDGIEVATASLGEAVELRARRSGGQPGADRVGGLRAGGPRLADRRRPARARRRRPRARRAVRARRTTPSRRCARAAGTSTASSRSAGTGSVTAGRNRAGETFRTMAIGFGERGGGSDLVLEALHAIARTKHGQAPPTLLEERFLGALGLERRDAAVRGDHAPRPRARRAELAPLVLGAAADDDPAAIVIAHEMGDALARRPSSASRARSRWRGRSSRSCARAGSTAPQRARSTAAFARDARRRAVRPRSRSCSRRRPRSARACSRSSSSSWSMCDARPAARSSPSSPDAATRMRLEIAEQPAAVADTLDGARRARGGARRTSCASAPSTASC